MAKRRVGVEYSPSMLEPVRPGAVSPDRVLCLPTFSHFVIVDKTSVCVCVCVCVCVRACVCVRDADYHDQPVCSHNPDREKHCDVTRSAHV
jgi:hypothetical protein